MADFFPNLDLTDAAPTTLVNGSAFTPSARPAPQAGSLAVVIDATQVVAGTFQAIVQTAVDGATDWLTLASRIDVTGAGPAAVFSIRVAEPILDRVRLQVIGDANSAGFDVTATWLCDNEILAA